MSIEVFDHRRSSLFALLRQTIIFECKREVSFFQSKSKSSFIDK